MKNLLSNKILGLALIIALVASLGLFIACVPVTGGPQITMVSGQLVGASPSATPSASPAASPTASITPTLSPTASPTANPTLSASPTPTVTTTPSASPAATPTATPTTSPGPTVSATPTPSATPGIGMDVKITIAVANFNIVPKFGEANATGEGHVHFFMDTTPPTEQGKPAVVTDNTKWIEIADTTYTWKNVPAGTYVFSVELVNNDHTPLTSPVVAAVAITVPASGAAPTASPAASPSASPTASPSATPSTSPSASPISS